MSACGRSVARAWSASPQRRNLACRFTTSATWAYECVSRRSFRPRRAVGARYLCESTFARKLCLATILRSARRNRSLAPTVYL
eukprot:2024380-Prymnesium_polylepis.1